MARVRSTIKISGKVGDEVHVRRRHGQLLRKAPKRASKKMDLLLKSKRSAQTF